MLAPLTLFVATLCLLLALAGVAMAVFALIAWVQRHELSLLVSAAALMLSAVALSVQGFALLRHFS